MPPESPLELGYYFFPSTHAGDPGHPRLDVVLRPKPTGRHFDPQRIFVRIVIPGGSEALVIEYPWTGQPDFTLFPGRIVIEDRIGRVVEALTFGGELNLSGDETHTLASFRSSAPILALLYPSGVAYLLAQEVEVLLAERRAAWLNAPEEFEQRLAHLDPLTFYHASLDALRRKYRHIPATESPHTQNFIHFLTVESQALHDLYHLPPDQVSLEELI